MKHVLSGSDEREIVTVVLTDLGDRTEMLFTQHGDTMNPEQYDAARHGWLVFFDTMAALFPAA